MKQFDGWMLPDHEEHLQFWMHDVNQRRHGRLSYQAHKYDLAVGYCKQKRVAVDIGAHVGLWAYQMAHDFESVHCFEPMQEHAKCWRANMAGKSNCILHECALGKSEGYAMVETRTPDSSGDTGVSGFSVEPKPGHVPMYALDRFELLAVDFMKVDCEGYELPILQGAERTLLRCKPVVIVEQKPGMAGRYDMPAQGAVKFLKNLGATLKNEISGDFILAWE